MKFYPSFWVLVKDVGVAITVSEDIFHEKLTPDIDTMDEDE
jgi:hypothetical protein